MSVLTSLLLFKLILMAGLATWLALVVLNNVIAFRNGVLAVGMMMNMQLFDQEPAIKTPLLARRVAAPRRHRLAYGCVVLVESIVTLLLAYAAVGFACALFGELNLGDALLRANLALSAFLAMGFVLLLGGTWFAYYVRQEDMQVMHFTMIVAGITSMLIVNSSTH